MVNDVAGDAIKEYSGGGRRPQGREHVSPSGWKSSSLKQFEEVSQRTLSKDFAMSRLTKSGGVLDLCSLVVRFLMYKKLSCMLLFFNKSALNYGY